MPVALFSPGTHLEDFMNDRITNGKWAFWQTLLEASAPALLLVLLLVLAMGMR